MQVLHDNFFYHSNTRLGADGGLESERHHLAEEQKLCRVRARKFSVETNRRRKALDERRKQWDMQEQRLRENILQQRRQQVQDATERFQRAHLPPSQRRRQSYKRNIVNIEDALNQIQGNLSSYTRQSSILSSTTNVSRSCSPSPKPPTVSKSSHRQALSALEAYTKLLQEQSRAEKLQDHSPQGSCNSESLSSKDSLDNEETNLSPKNLQYSYSSFLLDSEKAHPDQRKQDDLCPTTDLMSFSTMRLLGDNSRKLPDHKQRKQEEPEWPSDKVNVAKASWGFTSVEQTPKSKTQPAQHTCALLTLCEIMSGEPEHFEVKSQQNSPSDNTETNKGAVPKQELDPKLQRTHEDRQFKYPSATEIPLPVKYVPSPKSNIFLSDNTTDNLSKKGTLQQTGREHQPLSPQKEHSAFINNLNKVSSSEPKTEKDINTASPQHACLSNIEEEVHKSPTSMSTSQAVCEVRFIKGILKKQSKYLSGDVACVYGSGHLIFAKQVALAIRDSVELTRTKTKDAGGSSAVKKKLRWFDEVDEAKEQNLMQQVKGKSSSLSQSKHNSEDHQLSLTTLSGTPRSGPGMTSAASPGYHFTKEAWTDVGVQVSLPHERAVEVKVPRSSNRNAVPKVPRRERPARAGAGPVSSRTRKGTVIRPQSATEVSQIAKTQGKMMVPRPPPRMESVEEKTPCITKTPYGTEPASITYYKPALAVEQVPYKNNSEAFFSPYTQHVLTTDSTVMYTPLPPTHTCPFSDTKSALTPGHQETHSHCRRRGAAYNEKGLCLECTPTDEEISQLWQGVRSALSTKDAKNAFRRQAQESGRAVRKPGAEPSRPSAGNRRSLQNTQPPKSTSEPVRPFSGAYGMAYPNEGFDSAAQLHLAEVHAQEKDMMAAMETAQTRRSQQQGLTTISMEEQKILLSLDRLNHQLHCVQEHVVGNTGVQGLLTDAPHTKGTNHYKHRASSANSRSSRYQKKV